ncbi:MAG: response regulator, partial [Deltaproteobacteria bacterium]|nr:response regulator [Deltaproteobacteria bacterium]
MISWFVINAAFVSMREQYVRDAVEARFQRISRAVWTSAQEAARQTSLFTRLPVVMRAYEIALGGNIDDAHSPQSQAARELLRKELAPMLDNYREQFGDKLQLHFHLPNARSLVRLWRDKQASIRGEWTDLSDDLAPYRATVLDVNRNGRPATGIELGSGGLAIRGVIPVKAPDGRQIGSAEVLREFAPILDAAAEEGKIELILYVHKNRIALAPDARNPVAFALELQDPGKNPRKGDFVRVTTPKHGVSDVLITPELLVRGQNGGIVEYNGVTALATLPVKDYLGTQLGVLVCVMNTEEQSRLVNTAETTLALMLAGMAALSCIALLLGLRTLVAEPLHLITAKLQDIAGARPSLNAPIPGHRNDEIGELDRWCNELAANQRAIPDGISTMDARLFDAIPISAHLWDEDLRLLDCNAETLGLFALPNKRTFLDRFFDMSPPYQPCGSPSAEKAPALLKQAFAEGYCNCEWMHRTLDGEPVPCKMKLVRIRHKGHHFVVAYALDLRERTAMFNAMRNESAKFEDMAHWYASILDAIPFPVSVQDTKTRWTFVNAAFEKLLGKTRREILGLSCNNWGIGICDTTDCAIECARRGVRQTRFSHADASYQVDVEILRDLQGETTGYIEVVQDITRLEQMAKRQMEVESINQAKSSFLAVVSHEIRTPMNAILGITEIQLQNTGLSSDTAEAFNKIYTAGYTLLGIINDILDLSRMEAGKVELAPAKYEIASLINDTLQVNLVRIGNKPIAFRLEVDEHMPSALFGDDLRIKQILNNLLSNAFKYTATGKVTLSINAEYGEDGEEDSRLTLVCRVSDTGPGMTAEQVDRLFDEYSRFYLEANRAIEGIGLGMTITRQLVQMMEGKIFVESEPGRGSTFTVRLPQDHIGADRLGRELAESLQQLKAVPHVKTTQITREPMPYGSVLIVDDLETNLYVSRGLMAPYGLSIDTATSGFEAIEKIRDGREYDIVFMDHMMPGMDGLETTRILRDLGYTRPIIALTANAVVGQADMFMENGFNAFISKPVD